MHVYLYLESYNKAMIENSMLLTHLFILFSLIKKHSVLEKKSIMLLSTKCILKIPFKTSKIHVVYNIKYIGTQ